MIEALKEYKDMVCKPSWKWLKKHWKGYAVFVVITSVIPCVVIFWSDIVEFIQSKFKKVKEES